MLGQIGSKTRDFEHLEAKFVRKYTLEANDVQKDALLRDRWTTTFQLQTANDLLSHITPLAGFQYCFLKIAREEIVNSRDVEVSLIWYAL